MDEPDGAVESGDPLLSARDVGSDVVKTTRARWWILFVFCLLAMCQSCTWNIYSPIYPAVYKAFPSWTPSYMNW
jgi:hypothetical protein